MAVKWNKIYRGGVHRTTPETREVNAPASGTYLPGTAVTITNAAGSMTIQKGIADMRQFWYVIGEQLHGSVDDNQVGEDSSVRLYQPHSGDLLAGRAVAGIAILDDIPLTINADGRFAVAQPGTAGDPAADPPVFPTPADPIHAYVDAPASAWTGTPTPTVLDQLIPIKIR